MDRLPEKPDSNKRGSEDEDIQQLEDDDEDTPENAARAQRYNQLFQNLLRTMVFDPRSRGDSLADLVKSLKQNHLINSETIEQAFLSIPRADFVTPDLLQEAYQDTPIRVASMGFNISAPHMYAMCLDKLGIEPGHAVLDVGCGCGHLTALASMLTGKAGVVVGLEIRKDILDFCAQNIKKFQEKSGMDLSNIKLFVRNVFLPDPEEMKFDRIHVGACCPEVNLPALIALLNPGGVLVTPFADRLIRVKKDLAGKAETETITSVRYGDLVVPSEAEVKQAQLAIESRRAERVVVPPNSLAEDFARLVNCPEWSDIRFRVDGKIIPGHKLILRLRSPHFAAMLASGMKEAQADEIVIPNVSAATFLLILRFIYCGDVSFVTPQNAIDILEASNFFKCDRLKAQCEDVLKANIENDNAAYLLQAADRFDARQLKSCTFEYIAKHYKEVVTTQSWRELDKDLLTAITVKLFERMSR